MESREIDLVSCEQILHADPDWKYEIQDFLQPSYEPIDSKLIHFHSFDQADWILSKQISAGTELLRHCMVSHIPSHLKQEENNLFAGIKPTNHPYSLSFTTHWKTEGWLDFKQLIVSSNENYLPSISTCWYWYSYCAQNCNKTQRRHYCSVRPVSREYYQTVILFTHTLSKGFQLHYLYVPLL